jgi:hypothetical protein
MRRVKQSSLDRLNLMLSVEDLVSGLSIDREHMELTETDLRFPCPLHVPDPPGDRSVQIDRSTRYGWCRNNRCSFNQGGSLLWLYSRALRQDMIEVAEALAARKKLQLEYEFWIGDATAPQTDSFAYVLASAKAGVFEVVPVDELPALARLHPEGARFNPLRFESRDAEEVRERRGREALPLLGNLYLVLKAPVLPGARGADEGLDLALADARFLCRELMERYRVPEEGVAPFFCADGIHLEVDYRVFGAQPDPALARIYRRMAFMLGGVDDQAPARPLPGGGSGHPARTPTLVQDAYQPEFMWPLEGTRGGAQGIHKIWVSVHELLEKEARYLRELAREPRRPLDPLLRLSLERLARGLFLCVQERETRGRPALTAVLGEGSGRPAAAAPSREAVAPSARAATQSGAGFGRAAAVAITAPAVVDSSLPPSGRATLDRGAPASATSTPAKEDRVSATSGPTAGKPRPAAERPPAPAAMGVQSGTAPPTSSAGPAVRAAAAGRPAPPQARPESSVADLLARLTSRDRVPIPVTAFGSKTHPGDGLNQALQGGLHAGQVVGLAGATGEGKTTFALQLADGVAFDNLQRERDSQPTVPVLYLSGQTQPEALLMKSLSRLGKLDSSEILRGKSQTKDLQDALRIYQSFHRHMSVRQAGPDPGLEALRRSMEDLVRGGAHGALVVVDPLAALAPFEAADGSTQSQLCRRLAALARELPVAVLVVLSCRSAGRGGPLDYAEELAPVAEWFDVLLGLKTDIEIDRAGGVLMLDERVGWKKEWKAELKRKADAAPLKRGGIDYREVWKTEYSVLMTLKSRWQIPVHIAYHFHKAVHRFEEI